MSQQRRNGSRTKPKRTTLKHIESEDLTTRSAEVARFWKGAYDELVKMEEQLLGQLEGLSIDESRRTIAYRERSIHLTNREYQLFVRLADRSPDYTSATQLLAEAWHDSRLPEETVRTYIVRLRRKLAELGAPAQIANRSRRGYSLVFEDHSQESSGPRPRS